MIKFAVDPGPFSFNLNVSNKILIGNVPLRSTFSNFNQNQQEPAHVTINENAMALEGSHSPLTNLGDRVPISEDYPDLRKINFN